MSVTKNILDLASITGTIATLAGWLPPIAALVSILWISFQFYHSAPIKSWRDTRKKRG